MLPCDSPQAHRPQVFDILPQEEGEKVVKGFSDDRVHYFKVNISDVNEVQAACNAALQAIPKGSLFGAVHCAAVCKWRKWSNKMVDSVADFANALKVNGMPSSFLRMRLYG